MLVVSKIDRLSRSPLDFAAIMPRAQREGWALVALDSPADLTSPAGEAGLWRRSGRPVCVSGDRG
jgi:DNA invertase Pin-like site-specific DNA recombinase